MNYFRQQVIKTKSLPKGATKSSFDPLLTQLVTETTATATHMSPLNPFNSSQKELKTPMNKNINKHNKLFLTCLKEL